MGTVVWHAVLRPDAVFNLAGPRYLPEIIADWRGTLPYHHPRYEPLRDKIEAVYVAAFNEASGHYKRLQVDVLTNGFRNPIIVSCGGLCRRSPGDLPDTDRPFVCEYLGGSRLWVAQRFGLHVPAIVNDRSGQTLLGATRLYSAAEVLERFADRPRALRYDERGAYVNDLPYVHLPESRRYSLREQSRVRAEIVSHVREVARGWLARHDQ